VHLGDTLSKIGQRADVDWHKLYASNKKVVAPTRRDLPGSALEPR